MVDLSNVLAQLTLPEKELLFSIPSETEGWQYCNIGDGRWGGSTIIMALGMKELGLLGHIWTVDTYNRHRPKRISKLSRGHDVEDYITRCEGESSIWGKTFADRVFDFTFVDGNHGYDCALEDITNFMKNSKLLGVHDTNMNQVDMAIKDSGILDWELVHYVDKLKIFKPKVT